MSAAVISPELVLVASPEEARHLRDLLPDRPSWPAPTYVRPLAARVPKRYGWEAIAVRALLVLGIVNSLGSFAFILVQGR